MPITSSHFQNYLRSKKSMSASEVECCARLRLVLCENRTGPRRLMPANGAAYSRALGSRRRFGECCNSAAGRCFDAVRGEAHGLGGTIPPKAVRPPSVLRGPRPCQNISHPVTAGQHSGNVFDSGR